MILWWMAAALAGQVYLNDQPVPDQVLAGFDLSSASLRVDQTGAVHIDAPWLVWRDGQVRSAARSPEDASAEQGWWMLLEDLDSEGLEVEVDLNGRTVAVVRSGEGNVFVRVQDHVLPGANRAELRVRHDEDEGEGRIAVTLARGTLSGGLLRLRGEPQRWTLDPGSEGRPIRFEFTPDAMR